MDIADQQHHQRTSRGLETWQVTRLIELAASLEPKSIPLARIHQFEEVYWFDGETYRPTCRAVVEHAQRIQAVDLRYPIILSAGGLVMDGMHRVAKAMLLGHDEIRAVQFDVDPEPDEIDPSEASSR